MLKTAFFAALALVCAASIAEARPRHAHVGGCQQTGNVMQPCAYQPNFLSGVRSINVTMHRDRTKGRKRAPSVSNVQRDVSVSIHLVEHPAGCPRSAFCGCGAALHVFGHHVRDLWLASNWFKFPRAAPAPGMAAVRSHHVFVLEQHISGNTWLVYDANSGGGGTRVHARAIAGYTIVNPRA